MIESRIIELMAPIVGLIQGMTTLVFVVNVFVIVYCIFKFTLLGDNPHRRSQAISGIISGGIGMAVAGCMKLILGIISSEHSLEASNHGGGFFIILLLPLLAISIIGLLFDGSQKEEIVKLETFDEKVKKKEVENEVSYIEEDITIESIQKAILEGTLEENMAKHYTYLLEKVEHLENELDRLDIRHQHMIEETMKADMIALYASYIQVDESAREQIHEEVNEGLQQMCEQLDEIAESIQEKNKKEVRRKLAVIKKRYEK